ncbi:molybdopterin-dependent oxidoreductase [Terriglobus aquaticus]|uniref:Molybdopterin-dependent oxidoreductase n=1 Tax=Terriglobus aquaticus TaxID=940139 RepID=A0ABW9KQV2_9BACT|nr:molybdopterin-dependent oxidoreductase [Terriglobus aquaticus]
MSDEQQHEPSGHTNDLPEAPSATERVADLAGEQAAKPVAESASEAGEAPAVHGGKARPADPTDADDVLTRSMPEEAPGGVERNEADAEVLAASRSRTRRAFVGFGLGIAGAYGLRRYLQGAPFDEMIPGLLHKTYGFNADVSRAVFREHGMAPSYPVSKAENLRVNGVFGLKKMLQPDSYRLQMVGVQGASRHPRYVPDVTAWRYQYEAAASHEDQGHDSKTDPSKVMSSTKMAPEEMLAKTQQDENGTGRGPRGLEEAGESDSTLSRNTPGLLLTLDDFLPKLPKHDAVYQFKCIEGWSQFVHWGGVRMADFLEMFPPEPIDGKDPKYVYLETPDGDYYVGYDLKVLRHPQTLLVTEMNGEPLTQFHGAPLRLYTPLKYGYKQIKRIGLIAYTNDKPDDYWTRLGYDWYAGL